MRVWIQIILILLWAWPLLGASQATETSQAQPTIQAGQASSDPAEGKPDAFFPEPRHTFEQVLEGALVMHSFVLQNRGTADLEVKEVKTS